MTRFRGTSRVRIFGTRNLTRVVVAGIVAAGTPLALSGTANAATPAPTASDEVWDQLANCESGGKWNTNTGNGFSGGLQFTPSTWRANGGKGSPHGASRAEQIAVAERVLASQGWGAWPSCSKKINAKGKATPRSSSSDNSSSSDRSSASKSARTEVKPTAPAKPTQLTKAGANYTVAAGDTLSKIAQSRNVPGGWQALHEKNKDVLSDPAALKVGQQLIVN
jgi:LysM repeat protein